MCADPEKIIKNGGYWNSILVGETEEQPGEKSRTVLLKLKVSVLSSTLLYILPVCTSHLTDR